MEIVIVDEEGNTLDTVVVMQGQQIPDVGDYVELKRGDRLIYKRVWTPRIYGKSRFVIYTTEDHNG